MNTLYTLAAVGNWWESGIGAFIHNIMIFVAGIIMVVAILTSIGKGIKGEMGGALKSILGGLVIAALLTFPGIINAGIATTGKVVQAIIQTVDSTPTDTNSNPTDPGTLGQ